MAQTTVIGLFDNFADARSASEDLHQAGFTHADISMVSNNSDQSFGAHTTDGGANVGGAVHDTVAGAGKGAMYGGLTALAASLALLLIPGIGPIAAVGPLAAALSGATIGAVGGGLIGGLTGLGIPKEHAEFYNEGVRRGGTLVTVSCDETRADEAARILDRYNPIDVDERETYFQNSGFTGYSDTAPHYTPEQITTERASYATAAPVASATTGTTRAATPGTTNTVNTGETIAVPIVEETLAVGKREVERGGARIRRYVTETPVTETVTLHEEQVHVDRHPVDRTLSAADLNNAFTEGTIEVRATGEEAVVSKQARVVEEVVVNKEALDRQQTVSDTVRRTDVEVEELNTGTTTTGTTTTGTTGTTTSR